MTEHFIGPFPLIIRRHPRAKNLKLRFDAKTSSALLTLPPQISERKALQFARKHLDWIRGQYEKSPDIIPLSAGEIIPLRGHKVEIIHAPDQSASIQKHGGRLIVGGPFSGFETRLQNWLKKQARLALNDAVTAYEPLLKHKPHKVVVRDTQSRWGSCSSRKTLSFSWRLIMAPPPILHYVVAHEMAHLVEMNHGPAFWKTVERLYPDWEKSRHWLKSEGHSLMLIG